MDPVADFFHRLKHNPSNQTRTEFLGTGFAQADVPNPDFEKTTAEHYKWRAKYLKKAKFWGRLLRIVPGIRAVAVCNSVALGTASKDSDIDLLIITTESRLWTARLLVTALFQICGVRRHGKKIAGRLCLSFFCTEKTLDFEQIAIRPKDPYLAFWVSSLIPLFGKTTFEKIAAINRGFVLRHQIKIRFANRLEDVSKGRSVLRSMLERMLPDWLEQKIKRHFLPRTLAKYEKLSDKSGTIINDDMLKFHNTDARHKFLET
jgi:hypothetical protein